MQCAIPVRRSSAWTNVAPSASSRASAATRHRESRPRSSPGRSSSRRARRAGSGSGAGSRGRTAGGHSCRVRCQWTRYRRRPFGENDSSWYVPGKRTVPDRPGSSSVKIVPRACLRNLKRAIRRPSAETADDAPAPGTVRRSPRATGSRVEAKEPGSPCLNRRDENPAPSAESIAARKDGALATRPRS